MKNTIQSYCYILLSLSRVLSLLCGDWQMSFGSISIVVWAFEGVFLLWIPISKLVERFSSWTSPAVKNTLWLPISTTPETREMNRKLLSQRYDGAHTAHEDAKFIDLASSKQREEKESPEKLHFREIRAELECDIYCYHLSPLIFIVKGILTRFDFFAKRMKKRREKKARNLKSIHTNVLLSSNYILSFEASRQTFHRREKKDLLISPSWLEMLHECWGVKTLRKFIIPPRRTGERESTRMEWRNFGIFTLSSSSEHLALLVYTSLFLFSQEKRWWNLNKVSSHPTSCWVARKKKSLCEKVLPTLSSLHRGKTCTGRKRQWRLWRREIHF